ncbi:MAG: hypothetical protein K6B75_03890, partial [Lachnospiraceae bacterium]|nr:hypothetical protein [Lachnospiraceae bacterium]
MNNTDNTIIMIEQDDRELKIVNYIFLFIALLSFAIQFLPLDSIINNLTTNVIFSQITHQIIPVCLFIVIAKPKLKELFNIKPLNVLN